MTDLRKARNARYLARVKAGVVVPLGRPRTAKTYEGKPCRTCGSTIRYASTYNCVNCQCHRKLSDAQLWATPAATAPYGVHPEFMRWVASQMPPDYSIAFYQSTDLIIAEVA